MADAPTQALSIQGRITVDTSSAMLRALADALRARPDRVTVDFSGVTHIDTSGLATLLEVTRIARSQGTRLVLQGVHDQPRQLLDFCRIDHLLDFADGDAVDHADRDQ